MYYYLDFLTLLSFFFIESIYGGRDTCPGNSSMPRTNGEICNKYCENINHEICRIHRTKDIQCECTGRYALDDMGKCIKIRDCPQQQCKRHEIFQQCPSQCPATCYDKKPTCNRACGEPGCVCKNHYVRHNGRCILKKKCPRVRTTRKPIVPKCKDNMEWSDCPTKCPHTCQGKPAICTNECDVEKCVCKFGFVLHNGECIKKEQCPLTTTPAPNCGENMIWTNCSSLCPETCDGQNYFCNEICGEPACICREGFVYHDGKCISRDQCPQKTTPPPTCPENMEWQECPSKCTKRCNVQDTYCPKGCGEPACVYCKLYKKTTTTRRPFEIPSCPDNMEWSECPSHCPERCNVKDTYCERGCAEPACVCKEGFVLHRAKCIPKSSCKPRPTTPAPGEEPVCGENSEWSNCPSNCEETCMSKSKICKRSCGTPRCVCNDGYVKFNETCIPRGKCPLVHPDIPIPKCRQHEEYKQLPDCVSFCSRNKIKRTCADNKLEFDCACKDKYIKDNALIIN
uniref:Zonadhesin-like n=1 Tax=Parastrongyloides trichosuri TaxID=131310 RepID=A0A0N4ZGD5_PARTI